MFDAIAPRALYLSLCASLALSIGCDPAADDPGADGGVVGAGREGEALAAFYCDLLRRCPGRDDGDLFDELVAAGGDCEAYLRPQFIDEVAAYAASGASLDLDALAACRAVALSTCMPTLGLFAPCRRMFSGRAAAGEACGGGVACAAGLVCDDAGGDMCGFACRPLAAPGSPCFEDRECAAEGDGHPFCDRAPFDPDDPDGGEPPPGVCATFSVRAGAAIGAPCGRIREGEGVVLVGCGEGLACSEGFGEPGECRPVAQPGGPCPGEDFPCEGGFCIEGRCFPVTVGTAAGDGCDTRQLEWCNPFQRLVCDPETERCLATDGQAGEPCDEWDPFADTCRAGMICHDGRCVVRAADGEPCDPDRQGRLCAGGACVEDPETGDGVCGSYRPRGLCQ